MAFEQEHIEKLEQLQKQKENERIQQELDLAIARIENEKIQRALDAAIESLDQEIYHRDENTEEQVVDDQASQQSSSTEEELASHDSETEEKSNQKNPLEQSIHACDNKYISQHEENNEEEQKQNQDLIETEFSLQKEQDTTRNQEDNIQFQQNIDSAIECLECESVKHVHDIMTIEHHDQTSQPPTAEEELTSQEILTKKSSEQRNLIEKSAYSDKQIIYSHEKNKEEQGTQNQALQQTEKYAIQKTIMDQKADLNLLQRIEEQVKSDQEKNQPRMSHVGETKIKEHPLVTGEQIVQTLREAKRLQLASSYIFTQKNCLSQNDEIHNCHTGIIRKESPTILSEKINRDEFIKEFLIKRDYKVYKKLPSADALYSMYKFVENLDRNIIPILTSESGNLNSGKHRNVKINYSSTKKDGILSKIDLVISGKKTPFYNWFNQKLIWCANPKNNNQDYTKIILGDNKSESKWYAFWTQKFRTNSKWFNHFMKVNWVSKGRGENASYSSRLKIDLEKYNQFKMDLFEEIERRRLINWCIRNNYEKWAIDADYATYSHYRDWHNKKAVWTKTSDFFNIEPKFNPESMVFLQKKSCPLIKYADYTFKCTVSNKDDVIYSTLKLGKSPGDNRTERRTALSLRKDISYNISLNVRVDNTLKPGEIADALTKFGYDPSPLNENSLKGRGAALFFKRLFESKVNEKENHPLWKYGLIPNDIGLQDIEITWVFGVPQLLGNMKGKVGFFPNEIFSPDLVVINKYTKEKLCIIQLKGSSGKWRNFSESSALFQMLELKRFEFLNSLPTALVFIIENKRKKQVEYNFVVSNSRILTEKAPKKIINWNFKSLSGIDPLMPRNARCSDISKRLWRDLHNKNRLKEIIQTGNYQPYLSEIKSRIIESFQQFDEFTGTRINITAKKSNYELVDKYISILKPFLRNFTESMVFYGKIPKKSKAFARKYNRFIYDQYLINIYDYLRIKRPKRKLVT